MSDANDDPTDNLPWTGERFLPEIEGIIRLEHIHRYTLACDLAEGRDVLDIACGEGYGSAMLAKTAKSVVGVDIAADAVAHARRLYKGSNLRFAEGSATSIPLEDGSVDLVVSFETIEHLYEHDAMLAEICRVLRSGGVLLISSPNRQVYSDETGYRNPFHVRELYTDEFEKLIARYFPQHCHYGQKVMTSSVITNAETISPMAVYSATGRDDGLERRRYDLIIAAKGELPVLANSIYEAVDTAFDPYTRDEEIRHLRSGIERILGHNPYLFVELNRQEDFSGFRPSRLQVEMRGLREEYGRLLRMADSRFSESSSRLSNAAGQARDEARAAIERARLEAERAKTLEDAVQRIARDANSVVLGRHWKTTLVTRRLSNVVQSLRGRPKKEWPRSFSPETYIPARVPRPGAAQDPMPGSAQDTNRLKPPAQVGNPDGSVAEATRPGLVPLFRRGVDPHLTCISMVRNEAGRASEMMRHLCALFDRVIVINHLSTDDTEEIVARYNGHAGTEVVILRGLDPGYHQSEYMTASARALIAEGRSDWLFFVDFDEVLPFAAREEFVQALVSLTDADVIHSQWCNLALEEGQADTLQGARVILGPKVAEHAKVALNLCRLKDRHLTIAQGNHTVFVDGGSRPYRGERAFGIFHVPVNGIAAFRAKLAQGARAYEMTEGRDPSEGSHWRELNAEIDNLLQDPVLLREVALRYGAPLADVIADVRSGALTPYTRSMTLSFAQVDEPTDATTGTAAATFDLATIEAVMAQTFKSAVAPETESVAALSRAVHEALAPRTGRLDTGPGARASRVHDAMISAATRPEVAVLPTAWSGHIPFLFSLMEATRPRRYVELGVHAGASFFAACQHMKTNSGYGEAVAVDIWEGDYQAGFYDEKVFLDFRSRLNSHFVGIGSYIRAYFNQAVNLFEPGAIDLLHIDGLHTYEAVREDYETWRPIVAAQGTIIFHDTSEYQSDFGVWQFYEEVRNQAAASFRFRHCHGLGVLAFGDRDVNPAIELVEHLAENPARTESYYATLGSALFEQAVRRAT